MTIDDILAAFLEAAMSAQEDASVDVFMDGDYFVVHGNLYEEVITRGSDGVFVYAVPACQEISR